MQLLSDFDAGRIVQMYSDKCEEVIKLSKENQKLKRELKLLNERYFETCTEHGLVEED